MSRAKRWQFTLNNWTPEEEQSLHDLGNNPRHVEYLVWGRERGENGTPHLQGFVIFKSPIRFTTVKNRLGSTRYHIEVIRCTNNKEPSDYCKKDGDFEEYGEVEDTPQQGRRSDLDSFFEWCHEEGQRLGRAPTTPEAARVHPTIITKFRNAMAVQRLRFDREPIVDGQPREWQIDLNEELLGTADDRKIKFIVDPVGGKGKSWFVRYYLSNNMDAQFFSIGKRDDIAHAIKETTRVFLFDVPRGQMEFLQYGVLEMIKNRCIFSPKYSSTTKILYSKAHVVVFSNEPPDHSSLTGDRYDIKYL